MPRQTVPYSDLQVTGNFTFLTGASHAEELVRQAAALGHSAIALTDTNTLAGVVRAHVAAKEHGLRFVLGCHLRLAEPIPLSVLVYPTDLASYGRLCRLLTIGKRRTEKGECHLGVHDLIDYQDGLLAVVVSPPILDDDAVSVMEHLAGVFNDDRLSVAITRGYHQNDDSRVLQVANLATHLRAPLVATNDVHYHVPERRRLQDVLTCIRHGCTLDQAGFRLHPNAERHLKPPEEMARLFRDYPRAIARISDIVERTAGFSLDQLKYNYPEEVVPKGCSPQGHLVELAWAGAHDRYPSGVPDSVRRQIEHELRIIDDLNYAPYFLTVHDLVRFARSKRILCQGRGAAANSAVCYCLGVTSVDPGRVNVLFERFVSKERNEPPDIDIDFEHERREEVIQYLYGKYGRDLAALTAEVICYRGRSAIRDVGKAVGLSLDTVERLAHDVDWWHQNAEGIHAISPRGLNSMAPRLRLAITHAAEILGFPRHLSQHVGGFVITRTPLCELVPIENAAMADRSVIEWDKDDIEALGMLKVDVLGLGMLTCIRKCFELVEHSDGEALTLATIPAEDPATYDMICKADTVGVFQIESRAQMSMLPRLKPRCYYDLVIEVAIVRPGPIQGDMVHPFLRRRNGSEPVEYATPEVERVLGRTLGVPLFQEQCMALVVAAAGFTPGEADQLRRAMAAWKRSGAAIERFEQKIMEGMTARGYTALFAAQVFRQIQGFSGYGFPESHAASFALLVYASSWLKRHKPAAFAAALLNSQPMGFYKPAQIVGDARQHGVDVRPIDVNHSQWDCTLETIEPGRHGIRLGMRQVRSLSRPHAEAVARAVTTAGRFDSIAGLWRAVRREVPAAALRCLARADAFASMGLTRRTALWELQQLHDTPLPLFDGVDGERSHGFDVSADALPVPSLPSEVAADYANAQLSLKAHPVLFARSELDARGVTCNAELRDPELCPDGRTVTVSGIVLVRQRPGTASGIVFMTIEDETGAANLVLFSKVFDRLRAVARHSEAITATGKVEREGDVVHVIVRSMTALDLGDHAVASQSRDFH